MLVIFFRASGDMEIRFSPLVVIESSCTDFVCVFGAGEEALNVRVMSFGAMGDVDVVRHVVLRNEDDGFVD